MFDLDQAIAEWRAQMLSAGIKIPPLDELEAHLRDEIEHQAKVGLVEADVFQGAVEKIGNVHMLRQEFKKVENGHNIIRAIMLVIGWSAASFAFFWGVVVWNLDCTFFYFHPHWNLEWMLIIVAALIAIWFLAKASRGKAEHAASLLHCLILAAFGIFPGSWSGPGETPLWYRIAWALLLCVPGVFWVWWMRRHLAHDDSPTPGTQPIHSN